MLHDAARLAALEAAAVLDTPPEPTFDRLAQLARDALGAAAAYVVLVADDRQFLKSCAVDGGPAAGTSFPLSHSLCRHVVEASAVLAIDDTAADPRFAAHPAVVGHGIGAYLGAPIVTEGGQALGSVCVVEPRPREWTARDVAVLGGVAAAAGRELDLRTANRGLAERKAALKAVFAAMHDVVLVLDREGTYLQVMPTAPELLVRPSDEVLGRRMHAVFPAETADAFVECICRALAEGRAVHHDYALELPDAPGRPARLTHFHAAVSPLDAAAGTVLWVARDVTAERTAAAERAAAEARVRESERRLAGVVGSAMDAIIATDAEQRVVQFNAAAERMFGYAAADVLGRPLDVLLPERYRAAHRGHVAGYGATGGTQRRMGELSTLSARHADGTEFPIEASISHVETAGGRLYSVILRDVTARVQAEAALRASEARLRAMSSASPVGMFEADLAGRVGYVNPRGAEIWGMPAAEMLGDGWQARVHVDDLAPLLADWHAAAAAGEEFGRVYRLLLPSGGGGAPRVRWVHGRAAPLRDEAGRVIGSVGTVEDVTDRQEAETTQRRLTSILEAMPDVVTVAAPGGRIEYLNAAGRRLLGVRGGAEAVRAARLHVAALQPQFTPGGASAGAVAAAMMDGAWRGETTLTRCDGREIPVEQVILAHRGAGGEIEYLSSVLRDVTERKQAEATLRAFALVDELTGLYNRRGFLALAEREWEAARAAGQGGVLVYLDLDGFKPVNDTYGHAEGDRALAAVAGVLRRTFRDADVVGRLGGDEFVAFARCGVGPGGASALDGARATAARLHGRLHALLAEANLAGSRPYALAASVGVALFDPAAPATLNALMVEADAALYDRKRARGRIAA